MKRVRGGRYETVRTGGARTQQGTPENFKALMAYWMAYYDFLEAMSEDPRFVWLYGDMQE